MKDEKSSPEWMIRYRKRQYVIYSIGVPIMMCIPFGCGCLALKAGSWDIGLLLIGVAVFMFIFIIVCLKSGKRSIAKMEKELEEMKTLKEKIEKQ